MEKYRTGCLGIKEMGLQRRWTEVADFATIMATDDEKDKGATTGTL